MTDFAPASGAAQVAQDGHSLVPSLGLSYWDQNIGAMRPVSADYPLPILGSGGGGGGGSSSGTSTNAVASFQQTATASASTLPNATLANGIVLTAPASNTGTIYVGGSGVTASSGYPLKAGQSISYGVANSNQIYMVGTNTTDVLVGTGN